MAKPIKVTVLGDVNDLMDNLTKGEGGVAAFATKVGQSAKDVAKTAAGFAAAGLAAGGIGGAITESLDRGKITAALGAALGATPAEAAKYGQAAGQLYAKGYGENFQEVATSIEAVVSTLGRMDSGALDSASRKAMDLARVFTLDVSGAVNSVGILLKTGLAKDANAAFDLITKGMQSVPASVRQELLEASDEYSVFFQGLGFSGTEAFGVLVQAAKGGKIQLDKAGDALKEFRIRSVDMSATSVAGYKAIGLNAEDMAARILAGGASAKGAFQEILNGVLSIEDPVKREIAAVGLFGTQFEDLGNIDALAALNPMTSALKGVGGAADQLGESLHNNASANIDTFLRALSTLFVDFIGGKVIPAVSNVVTWVRDNFGPALDAVGVVLTSVVIPALSATVGWFRDNGQTVAIVAGVITALLLPALIASGVQHTIAGGKAVASWAKSSAAAQKSALVQARSAAIMSGRFVAAVATNTAAGVRLVAQWTVMGAQAVAQGIRIGAAWAASAARTVASLVVTAAGFVAQGAVMVASFAVTAASVVAGWVAMGAQALIRGAQMAAAWVMAMGPVGWVIAAVVGLVALIVANWDTAVAVTKSIFGAIWSFLQSVWSLIVSLVSGAVNGVISAIGWLASLPGRVAGWFGSLVSGAVGKLGELVSWLGGLPGRVLGAIGDFGSLLLNAGKDLLTGLWNGIKNAAGWLKDKIFSFFGSLIPDWVKDILGINSPSKVFAAIGQWIPPGLAVGIERNSGTALAAAAGLAAGMVSEVARADFGSPMAFALAGAGASSAGLGGVSGSASGPAPVGGPGTAGRGSTTVNVYANTNADPHEIGTEVAWAVRNSGR